MSIREELILKVLAKEDSVVELADQYGVSRKTIYKWLARYESKGLGCLVDESRRPKRSPLKTSAELALEIVQLRKEHPRWDRRRSLPSWRGGSVLRRQSDGLLAAPAHLIPVESNDLWTGLQGVVAHQGREAMRSAHDPGRVQPLRAGAAAPDADPDRGRSPDLRAAVRQVRVAEGHPE